MVEAETDIELSCLEREQLLYSYRQGPLIAWIMVARMQALIVVGLLTGAGAWMTLLVHLGHPILAWMGAVAILLGYALILGVEFVSLYIVLRATADRPTAHQLLSAWWGEVVSASAVFFWRQPFRSVAQADNDQEPDALKRAGVVLVHGFMCNRGFWNPWMRELRAKGVPFIAVSLEPVFGSIDHYPQVIESAVARLASITAMPVVLVGHSMGGLAIRAWRASFPEQARVRRIISIGTPHRGTWLARFSYATNGRQMRLASPWLTQLAASEPPSGSAVFTCFFGRCDNVVYPASSATLPGADNRHVDATAHVEMAFCPPVFNELMHWLAQEAHALATP
jgi:triacylglycerol lipase